MAMTLRRRHGLDLVDLPRATNRFSVQPPCKDVRHGAGFDFANLTNFLPGFDKFPNKEICQIQI